MASEARGWLGIGAILNALGLGASAEVEARAANATHSRPTPSLGYWRGPMSDGPVTGGQGSGMGQKNQGYGMFSQGTGPAAPARKWEPTVIYLLVLLGAEVIVFGLIGRALTRFGAG